jgi:hypothetical protein
MRNDDQRGQNQPEEPEIEFCTHVGLCDAGIVPSILYKSRFR